MMMLRGEFDDTDDNKPDRLQQCILLGSGDVHALYVLTECLWLESERCMSGVACGGGRFGHHFGPSQADDRWLYVLPEISHEATIGY